MLLSQGAVVRKVRVIPIEISSLGELALDNSYVDFTQASIPLIILQSPVVAIQKKKDKQILRLHHSEICDLRLDKPLVS